MYTTIKKFRNSGFSKRTNTFEKFRMMMTGNTLSFYQLPEDIRTSRFSKPPSCALFWGGANISSVKCYFFLPGYLTLCLSVSRSVSYILRLCKVYIPGTRGCVIYSPGTALTAAYKKPFLFRFSIAMQQKKIGFS